ncbi:MAG TPA: hypothetical protein VKQ36_12580 [Ktedonobacterales bacterium]|nr:hypothetical protein [Ktedonobacterales bacterium]
MTTPRNASSAASAAVTAVSSPLTRVFVDTSGWAEPILQNTSATAELIATYRALLNRQQRLVTSNYVLTEVVALLTARRARGTHAGTGLTRPDILQYIEDIQALPWVQVIHVDEAIHQEEWRVLRGAQSRVGSPLPNRRRLPAPGDPSTCDSHEHADRNPVCRRKRYLPANS